MTSPDGITWTSQTAATNNTWYSVTYGNNLFVAVSWSGTNNRVMTSTVSGGAAGNGGAGGNGGAVGLGGTGGAAGQPGGTTGANGQNGV